jgi:hypothetical protein
MITYIPNLEKKGRHSSQVLYGRATMFYCGRNDDLGLCEVDEVYIFRGRNRRGNRLE